MPIYIKQDDGKLKQVDEPERSLTGRFWIEFIFAIATALALTFALLILLPFFDEGLR